MRTILRRLGTGNSPRLPDRKINKSMLTWKVIGIIGGLLELLGVLFDALMLKRQKTSLHTKLIGYWDKIDETAIPNIAVFMLRIVIESG